MHDRGLRERRPVTLPAALIVSLVVHAAVAAALIWQWGGAAPQPLPTVVVELVDGPPGQRNAVLDQPLRNSGIAAQPEPQHEAAKPADAQSTEPAQTTPVDRAPPPDAQRPPDTKPEPLPQASAILPLPPPIPPTEPPKKPVTKLETKPAMKPATNPATKPAADTQTASRPTADPTTKPDNSTAPAPTGELTPPRFGLGTGQNPIPEYPDYARRRGWEGRVVLTVEVDEAGRGRSVSIKQSSGHKLLDDAALAAVRTWRFVPGMRGNLPVTAQVDVPIRFRLDDAR